MLGPVVIGDDVSDGIWRWRVVGWVDFKRRYNNSHSSFAVNHNSLLVAPKSDEGGCKRGRLSRRVIRAAYKSNGLATVRYRIFPAEASPHGAEAEV
jgi:hypothetical protein